MATYAIGDVQGCFDEPAFRLSAAVLFELRHGNSQAWLYPGLNKDLANQPYPVIRRYATR